MEPVRKAIDLLRWIFLVIRINSDPDMKERLLAYRTFTEEIYDQYDALTKLQIRHVGLASPDDDLHTKISDELQRIIDKSYDYEEHTARFAVELEKKGYTNFEIQIFRQARTKIRREREMLKFARNTHMNDKDGKVVVRW